MSNNESQTIKELPPIQKDQNSQIRLAIKQYRDSQYIDIRTYFLEQDSNKWLPTKKGVTIPVNDTFDYLEDLTAGLEELYQFLARQEDKSEDKTSGDTSEG